MKYKCKICPKKLQCDEKLKQERLMYRPFENIKEFMEAKYGYKQNCSLCVDGATEKKAH